MKEQRLRTQRWQILFLWWQVRVVLPAGPRSSQKHAPVYRAVGKGGGAGKGWGAQWPSMPCKWVLIARWHPGPDRSWHWGRQGPLLFSWPQRWSCACLQTLPRATLWFPEFALSSLPVGREKGKAGGWVPMLLNVYFPVWQTCQRKWEAISDRAPIRSATLGKVLRQRYFTEIRRNLGIDFWQAIPEVDTVWIGNGFHGQIKSNKWQVTRKSYIIKSHTVSAKFVINNWTPGEPSP